MARGRFWSVVLPVLGIVCFAFFALATLIVSHPAFGDKPKGARLARMRSSADFYGGRVRNREGMAVRPSIKSDREAQPIIRREPGNRVPRVPLPAVRTRLDSLPRERDAYVWFGHSSFYVQLSGKRILFDPIFTYAFPSGLVLKPFPTEYRYGVEDMPPLDYVFLTHDHFDHLDYGTVRALDAHAPLYVCPLGVGAHLEFWGVDTGRIVELGWDEGRCLDGVITVTCRTAHHFSGRFLNDQNATFFGSYVVETPTKRLFFSGDGGYGKHFREIREAHGDFDYAFLECGQYNERWSSIHCSPHQVARAAEDLGAKRFVPIHNSKFALALHSWYDPLDSIFARSAERHLSLLTPRLGEVLWLNGRDTIFSAWWRAVAARERKLAEAGRD